MTSFSQNLKKNETLSSQILVKVICVKFHQNRPEDAATKGCDRQTDTQTNRHTDTHTDRPHPRC